MYYVITPPEETSWHVSRRDLVELLRRELANIEVNLGGADAHESRDVVWRVFVNGFELDGSQERAGQAQYLDGQLPAVAGYAAWWRRHVPAEQPLILCDEGYNAVIELKTGMTTQALLDALTQQ